MVDSWRHDFEEKYPINGSVTMYTNILILQRSIMAQDSQASVWSSTFPLSLYHVTFSTHHPASSSSHVFVYP